ncbi:hypothetical protein SAMN02787118_12998 [Streptomyces mirabilis]|jgi:hypothetical protein|uniref:Uncharacterized protein n=1 Tax=Streptomyces mirabilis TaxID=68239 RepID=A0A1I2V080_9ACTN|nr:hypothetical protein SAMN02787118_12998 [Streptomyces mirabilis]
MPPAASLATRTPLRTGQPIHAAGLLVTLPLPLPRTWGAGGVRLIGFALCGCELEEFRNCLGMLVRLEAGEKVVDEGDAAGPHTPRSRGPRPLRSPGAERVFHFREIAG